jgi:hypothetical protein
MPTNHFISLQTGIDMTTLYRQEKENILATAYKNQNILPISETFDRAAMIRFWRKPVVLQSEFITVCPKIF